VNGRVFYWPDAGSESGQCTIVHRSSAGVTRCWTIVDRTLGSQRQVVYREHPERQKDDRTRLVGDDRTLVRVRSKETASSDRFAHYARVELTGVSGQKDQRVQSPRYLLSWPSTVMFCMRGYKYLSHSSMGALLLIYSAEKHLWSARECKSLLRWLRFENLRLRTSLVHRE
jgi:hypothetical protein